MEMTKYRYEIPNFQVETLPQKHGNEYPFYLHFVKWGFTIFGQVFPKAAAKLAFKLFTTPRTRAAHKRTDEVIESARLFEVLYGKIILKCYEWGRGERTVLLVHGWESRGTALRSFVPGLVQAGYRVVAFDGPAHGNSGGKQTNLPEFAGAVRAVLTQVGPVHGIITHSFGGSTTSFALAHLDNSIEVERLVLVAVPASTRKVVADFAKLVSLPKRTVEALKAIMHRKLNGIHFHETDLVESLAKAKVGEVLVVHDKFDPAVDFDSAEAIFEKYDHASLLVTQGYGHFHLMKHPEVVHRVINFVRGEEEDVFS
ncbi:MAG: alpha/beta hydrolase, partial [Saprospiraceae bacterium]|nr:alpha/beta hydrolase [Saprospiraceae bacterium]